MPWRRYFPTLTNSKAKLDFLKGRGAFVFSDPGGAKPVLAFAAVNRNRLSDCLIISDRTYGFFNDFSLAVTAATDVKQQLLEFHPDFLLTGTSYTSEIERKALHAAREANIYSASYLDHTTNVQKRFEFKGEELRPSLIITPGKKVTSAAMAAGFHPDNISESGNPYLEFLAVQLPSISRSDLLAHAGVTLGDRKLVVYGPDPLSNLNGISEYGFDEVSATQLLDSIAGELSAEFLFVLNPHPNQDANKLAGADIRHIQILPAGLDVHALLYQADIVIGFFSNLLKEARAMGKSVIRFMPTATKADPYNDENIGTVTNELTLKEALLSCN